MTVFHSTFSLLKRALSIPHRMLIYPYHEKEENGVIYASHFKRGFSVMFDLVFCMLLINAINFVLVPMFSAYLPIDIIEKNNFNFDIGPAEKAQIYLFFKKLFAIQIIKMVAICTFFLVCWTRFGCTPGKFVLGLRIVDRNTLKKPTLKSSIKRLLISPFSILCLCIGVVWMLVDEKKRTWHDIVGNTIVVLAKSKAIKQV